MPNRLAKLAAGAERTKWEDALAFQLRAAKIEGWEREYRFAPGRMFRADFAWPEQKLLVEVDGATHNFGRHNRHEGITSDCVKGNLATALGYRLLRVTGEMVESGEAVKVIEGVLG